MPWTLSHPAAILPLRRFCPEHLNLAALVMGSFAPDLGYYLGQFPATAYAHTLAGTFLVSLPSAAVMLLLFYLLRKPFCFVLPNPHRELLAPLCARSAPNTPRSLAIAFFSLLLGVVIHNFWDAWTHDEGWFAEHIRFLRWPIWTTHGIILNVTFILQEGSTLVGLFLLCAAYAIWLKRKTGRVTLWTRDQPWRYWFWGLILLMTALVSVPIATYVAATSKGFIPFRVFLFFGAISSAITGFILSVLGSSVIYLWHARRDDVLATQALSSRR